MTENSKSREQAEIAFSKTQTEYLARTRANAEIDVVAADRDAKTARLRELRLEREANAVPQVGKAKTAPNR
ncbi:hypothetical protein [Rhizobium sp. HT1-10]|uniref:hypothetical protein n=1 Tax=Rhizobium sp. HT1-10 TaxID=3111638 RepID=UPI003C26845D